MGGFDAANAHARGDEEAVDHAVDSARTMAPHEEARPGEHAAQNRPEIVITTQEYEVVDQAVAALCAASDVYKRGGNLVHVVRDESKLRGVTGTGIRPRIFALPLARLREILSEVAQWTRVTNDDGEKESAHPPNWAVQEVAARRMWRELPYLEAVVETPILRPDGTVLDEPGYDRATGILFEPGADFGRVPVRPTHDDARRALDALLEVVVDFPFVSGEYRSAYLSGLLTPFARYAFRGPVPLHLIDANTRGTGKSLLADTVSLVVAGREMPRTAYPKDDAEMEKRITSIAIAGEAMMLIDNVVGELGSPSLDAALTSTTWNGRVLGKSEMIAPDTPLLTIWWATGNNVALVADTARRVLHIRMDSDEEKPEERSGFRHPNLLAWLRKERPRLVRSALTLLRAYFVAGQPDMNLKPWGSFDGWSRLIRHALVWAGEPDPGLTRNELAEQCDTQAGSLAQLIEGLSLADPGGGGLTAAQLLERSAHGNDLAGLREAINQLCPTRDGKPPTANRLGRQIQLYRRRVIDGRYIDRKPNLTKSKHAAEWIVFTAKPSSQ